jgi:hypothetical protein
MTSIARWRREKTRMIPTLQTDLKSIEKLMIQKTENINFPGLLRGGGMEVIAQRAKHMIASESASLRVD